MPRNPASDAFLLEGLEQRVLLSADPTLLASAGSSSSDPLNHGAGSSLPPMVEAILDTRHGAGSLSEGGSDLFAGSGGLEPLSSLDSDADRELPATSNEPLSPDPQASAETGLSDLESAAPLSDSQAEPTPSDPLPAAAPVTDVVSVAGSESASDLGGPSGAAGEVAAQVAVVPKSPLSEAASDPASGVAGASSSTVMVEQLTETLKAANGPPSGPEASTDGAGTIILRDGEMLGGEGDKSLDLVNESGVVNPGHSPGVLNVGSFSQGPDGTNVVEITGWNAGNAPVVYDQIIAAGNVTLDGTLQVQWSGPAPAAGSTFSILKWGGVRVGQFANYLGTTLPGNDQLALVPEYDDLAKELRLRVVDTEAVVPEVERTLRDVANLAANLLNISLPASATTLPVIGKPIKDVLDAKKMVEDTIQARIFQLIALLPTQAQVTRELEKLDGEVLGPFTVEVKSVRGYYSQAANPNTYCAWDVKLDIVETKLTALVADGLNMAVDFLFGPASKVTLENRLELDFTFGIDDVDANPLTPNAFVDLRSITPRVTVTAANLDPLKLTPAWLQSNPLTNISASASISFEAFIQFAPDPNLFPSGHWLSTLPPALPNFSNFQETKGASVDATVTLNLTQNDINNLWAPFTVAKYEGTHTLRIVDSDLFDNVKPDVTLVVDGDLIVLGQRMTGVFTFTKPGASTDVAVDAEISNLELQLTAGVGPALRILKATGSGNFLLKDNGDIAGIASLTVAPGNGPQLPNIDDFSGTFTLTFNDSNAAISVPVDLGPNVNVPGGGPYYRIDGANLVVDLGIPDVVLKAAQFTFEPVDLTPGNPNDNLQEIVVGVQGLSFDFTMPGGQKLVQVTNGAGVLLMTRVGGESGMVANITSANVAVDIYGIAGLTGQFSVVFNEFNQAFNRNLTVLGQVKALNVAGGKFFRVQALNANLSLLAGQIGNALQVSGNFAFEQFTDPTEGKIVTVGFNGVQLPFLDGAAQQVLVLSNISGIFVSNAKGMAGQATVGTFNFGVPGAIGITTNPNSNISFQINTTNEAISKTIQLGAQTLNLNVDIGPFFRFRMLRVNLTVANFDVLTGDFGIEQRQSTSGQQMITIAARNVDFNLGPVTPFLNIRDGNGLFVISNGQFAGSAQVVMDVISTPWLVIDDGDPAPGVKLGFNFNNNVAAAIDQVFDFSGASFSGGGGGGPSSAGLAAPPPAVPGYGLVPVKTRAGQYFEVSGPVSLSFGAGGGTQQLSGVFTFSDVDAGGQKFVGVKAEELNLKLKAGGTEVVAFRDGTGQFAFFNDGMGGKATLDFEVGIVNLGGDIRMELNTTNHAILATQGGYNINLAQPNYLKVIVDGFIAVGPGSFPFAFTVENDFAANEVIFRQNGQLPPNFLVKVDSTGNIIFGTLPALPNFAQISEGEFLPLIKQFINWLDQFRQSSVFDTTIPFTDGTTLGDVFDYAQWFVDHVYPKVASVEMRSVSPFRDGNGNPLPIAQLPLGGSYGAFTVQLQIGTFVQGKNGPVSVTFPAANFVSAQDLVNKFNAALAADPDTNGKVISRLNKDGQPVIALSETEVTKHSTLILTFSGPNHPMVGLGFSNNQRAIEVERGSIGDMVQALGTALGLSPPPYNPNKKVITFDFNLNQNLPVFSIPFEFGKSLGLIADATLNGNLSASVNLKLGTTIGFDFNAVEVPMVITSPVVPVPSNGRLSADAQFDVYLNGSNTPFTIFIDSSPLGTGAFVRMEQLVNYINAQFATHTYLGQPLNKWIIARKADTSIVIQALQEDRDGDKHFDNLNEDANHNGKLDPLEDQDGDGRLDLNEDTNGNKMLDPGEDADGDGILDGGEDLNGDGQFQNRLGVINLIVVSAKANNTAATELGIGIDAVDVGGVTYMVAAAKSSIKGLFIDNTRFDASLNLNGTATGSLRIGFLEVKVQAGTGFSTTPPINLKVDIRNGSTGQTRFYIPELMQGLASLDDLVVGVKITGGLNAQLKLGLDPALGIVLPANASIGIQIPDINDLTFNPEPYAPGKTGTFLTYTGLNGIENFSDIGFLQILQALRAVVSTLSQIQGFGFLDQEIPFIEVSIADMLKWAEKVGKVVDGVEKDGPLTLQRLITVFQTEIEKLFHINGRNQQIFKITVEDVANPIASIVSGNVEADFNPAGTGNGLKFKANGTSLNGARIKIIGSDEADGGLAKVSWDAVEKILLVKIDPGVTTADAVISALAGLGSPWSAVTTEGVGTGTLSRTAIKVHLNFTAGYGHTIPLQFSIQKLLGLIAGDNTKAAEFLDKATSLIRIQGDGSLSVSASAGVVLDFGLDVTNPLSIRPFVYDSTKAEVKLEVIGTDLEFEASLGSIVGIFIRDGSVTLDADGDPDTQGAASLALGFKDNNGDGRHYFSESLFDAESFGLTARAGLTADLPIFAPTEGIALGGDADANGDDYPDNHLVVDIPDLVRLFLPDQANSPNATIQMRGPNNDFVITTSDPAKDKFKVVFVHNPAVAPKANYDAGSNTLTITINSGVTTTNQIIALLPAQAPTFSGALTPDDDADPKNPPQSNTGNGKLAKTTISTPDFSKLFDNLDLCAILDKSAGLMLDGLDSALGFIQDGLNDAVAAIQLPLIGDGLQGTANFIQDFREGLLADLRNAIAQNGGSATEAIKSALKQVIWNILGTPGAKLLVDPVTGVALETYQQIDLELDCDNGLQVNLRLHKALAAIDTGDALNIDIGVPGFGLKLDGSLQLELAFDFKLGFGLNKTDGFYFVTAAAPNLKQVDTNDINGAALGTSAELFLGFAIVPKLAGSAQLFFLQLDVEDLGSFFRGGFEIDLRDPNNDGKLTFAELTSPGLDFAKVFKPKLGAEANIDLHAALSFGGSAAFPRVLANFHLDWSWDLDKGQQGPNINVDEVYLDLGSYISEFLGPVLGKIREFVEPADPILEMVTTPLPIISDLLGEPITFLDLAEAFGYLDPGTRKFIEIVAQVVDVIQLVGNFDGKSLLIPMGAFEMIAGIGGGSPKVNPTGKLLNNFQQDLESIKNANPNAGGAEVNQTVGFTGKLDASVFHFPIWENPAEIFGLFVGNPVRLIEVRFPTFKFEFTYVQKIPIYGPLYARFGGTVGAELTFGFGYDTYGIQKFISSEEKNVADIFDGFYVIDFDESGNERPEIRLYGEIFAGASIDLGVAEAGVEGGVRVTVDFDLNDFNDDGRIRISEMIALAEIDPLCLFNIHGKVDLFLRAFLKVNLLLFSIEAEWEFLTVTLFEFELTCQMPEPASFDSGTLTLHLGTDAGKRLALDTTDTAERFIVKHISDEGDSETVEVNWEGFVKEFNGVKKIYVKNAGKGDDYIDLRGTQSEVDIRLGDGKDTIYLGDGGGNVEGGDGDDTIIGGGASLQIRGGAGEDVIEIAGAAVVFGDDGADKITTTDADDTIYGGGGADVIRSGGGNDLIEGGLGNDIIDAGLGDDTVRAGDGADEVTGGDGNDVLYGEDGDDLLLGGSGRDVLIGGNGSDQLFGHSGIDLLVGSTVDSWSPAVLPESLAMVQAGLNLSGIGSKDNTQQKDDDFIIGGGSYDFLFGGRGDDFLFGGNFYSSGQSDVIEEDDNDFIDGGTGNDELFGDDAQGKTGDRDTGIAVKSVVWLDLNGNGIRDEGEPGAPGVKVEIFSPSDPTFHDTATTKDDGSFKFTGLDPDKYFLVFTSPFDTGTGKGLKLVQKDQSENESIDSDADINEASLALVGKPVGQPHIGASPTFMLHVNETLTTVGAGVIGQVVLSVEDVSLAEGATGARALNFSLNLSRALKVPVTVDVRTVDATAVSTGDYKDFVAITQKVRFEPGEKSKTLSISILGDSIYEGRYEQFQLRLENPVSIPQDPVFFTNGGQVAVTAVGTIIGDDGPPELTVSDYVPESSGASPVSENHPAKFTISLSNPSADIVTVQWKTVDALAFEAVGQKHYATTGVDYQVGGGVVVFLPGDTEKTVTVNLLDDAIDEYDERFFVQLYNAQKALLADDHGVGIIADDDRPVRASLTLDPIYQVPGFANTTEVFEGGTAIFKVVLNQKSEKDVYVTYASSQGTALTALPLTTMFLTGQRPDFIHAPDPSALPEHQRLHFAPGQTEMLLVVQTRDQDTAPEPLETFFVNLTGGENVEIARNHGVIRIKDNDSGIGNAGISPISFSQTNFFVHEYEAFAEITLVKSAGVGVATAVFQTQDITATNLEDYDGGTFIVTFAANEFVKTVQIPILQDKIWEGDEQVRLAMRGFTGKPASAAPFVATLTILDDEQLPTVYLLDSVVTVTEGVDPKAVFRIHSHQQVFGVRVHYKTVDLTAFSPGDYTGMTGFVDLQVIVDGGTDGVIEIPIKDDVFLEAPESFGLVITSVEHAKIDQSKATGIIRDDEKDTIKGQVFQDSNGNGFFDFNERGLKGVVVVVSNPDNPFFDIGVTDEDGLYSVQMSQGDIRMRVIESSLTQKHPSQPVIKFYTGYELTTGNDTQTIEFLGGGGLELFEPVGYRAKRLNLGLVDSPEPVGRGGTDDTLFGGPGNDFIDAGAGDDHVVGGHWQTATNYYAPINKGDYDAKIRALDPLNPPAGQQYAWLRPLNGLIFDVDTTNMGNNASVSGSVFVKYPNTLPLPYGGMTVNLLDDTGNVVDTVKTTVNPLGNYAFPEVFPGNYQLEFVVPKGFSATNNIDPDTFQSAVFSLAANGTQNLSITIQPGPQVPTSDEVTFHKNTYPVSQGEEDTFAVVRLVRGDASRREAVVVWTEELQGQPDAAKPNIHYKPIRTVVNFDIGQYERTVVIKILADGPIPDGKTVRLKLHLEVATGQPLATAFMVIKNPLAAIEDNDTLRGGDDWDLILGDSGYIPKNLHPGRFLQPAPGDPNPPPVLDPYTTIKFSGGPGDDSIDGGRNIDRIFGQGGEDIIDGGYGSDIIDAGIGNDLIAVSWGFDIVEGGADRDVLEGTRDADHFVKKGAGSGGEDLLEFDLPGANFDTTITFTGIEHVKLLGGVGDNRFTLTNWSGSAEIFGFFGNDRVIVDNDIDMTLKDGVGESLTLNSPVAKYILPVVSTANAIEDGPTKSQILGYSSSAPLSTMIGVSQAKTGFAFASAGKYLNGHARASLKLGNGSLYTMTGVETSHLIGGPGANRLDASQYSGDVTFQGKGGDDEMLGGKGDDTFVFTAADTGVDTIFGNGDGASAVNDKSFDTLDFTALTQDLKVDLHILNTPEVLWTGGPLSLVFGDEDLDAILGGSGDDILIGNARDNLLLGGPGDDTLEGRDGSETYSFDADPLVPWGKETVIEDPTDPVGHDVLDFSKTTDVSVVLDLNSGAQQVIGGLTLILGAGGFEEVIGGAKNDTLIGNALANTLRGGLGDDTLIGNDGDDRFVGGPGFDTMAGGGGIDTLEDEGNVNFQVKDTNVFKSGGEIDAIGGIERAELKGGQAANTFDLTGWTGDAVIDAGGHVADRFLMTASADIRLLDLGAKDVRLELDHPVVDAVVDQTIDLIGFEIFVISGGETDDYIDGSALTPNPAGQARGAFTLQGGLGNDQLLGTRWDDVLRGGPGNDTFEGGAGNDVIEGGEGTDTYVVTRDAQLFQLLDVSVVVDEDISTDGSEMDDISSVENLKVTGGAGDNIFDATGWTGGDITVDGGGHVAGDTIRATGGGVIKVTDTSIEVPGSNGTITLMNIERANLSGSAGDDVLDASGFSGQAILSGLDGNDTLIAGPGIGLLFGGEGNDRLVSGSGNTGMQGGAGNDTFVFDTDGPLGADVIADTDGTDTLDFRDTTTLAIVVNLGTVAAVQVVNANLTLNLLDATPAIENVIGTSLGDQITGNSLNNRFEGRDGADQLVGLGGDDVLVGGAGSDNLSGGSDQDRYEFDTDTTLGADVVVDSGGVDTFDFSGTTTLGVQVNLALSGGPQPINANHTLTIVIGVLIENVIGGAMADNLVGNLADNTFIGGTGADAINGGLGTDTVFETRDADFVLTNTQLRIGLEIDSLTGVEQALLVGGAGNNTLDASAFTLGLVGLSGMAGDDHLIGGAVGDVLLGGAGNDVLEGRAGNDNLRGGLGKDTYRYVLGPALGVDTIREEDNEGTDRIVGVQPALVDLTTTAAQVISPTLTLILVNLNVEDVFP